MFSVRRMQFLNILILIVVYGRLVHTFNFRTARDRYRSVLSIGLNSADADEDMEFEAMKSMIDSIASTKADSKSVIEEPSYEYRKPVAIVSALLGALSFFTQNTQQVSGVALLRQMEKDSTPFQVYPNILCSW